MESSSKLASRSDNLLVTGLKPGTRYELNITAVYTTGRSKETRPTYLYTGEMIAFCWLTLWTLDTVAL